MASDFDLVRFRHLKKETFTSLQAQMGAMIAGDATKNYIRHDYVQFKMPAPGTGRARVLFLPDVYQLAVIAFLASPAAAYVRGTCLAVDGGRLNSI